MGRFTSPDPLYYAANRPGDPQRFNLYSYVRNSPLGLIDPDGKDGKVVTTATDPEEKQKQLDETRKSLQKLAPGTKVDADGKVHKPGFFRRLLNNLTGHSAGNALISRIVDNKKTTVILARSDGEVGFTSADKLKPAIENLVGVKKEDLVGIIDFGLNARKSAFISETSIISETSTEIVSPELLLAHELIHADNFARNPQPTDNIVQTRTVVRGNVRFTEQEKGTEFRAVGFAGFTFRGDITENQIRAELGKPPRAYYNAPTLEIGK
jgi:hypothetical protein